MRNYLKSIFCLFALLVGAGWSPAGDLGNINGGPTVQSDGAGTNVVDAPGDATITGVPGSEAEYNIISGGTLQVGGGGSNNVVLYGVANVNGKATLRVSDGGTLVNDGSISLTSFNLDSSRLVFEENSKYVSNGGVIVNNISNSDEGRVIIHSSVKGADNVAGSGVNAIFASLVSGAGGNIGFVDINGNINTAINAAGVGIGFVTLNDTQTNAAAINVGGAILSVVAAGTNTFSGPVNARSINTSSADPSTTLVFNGSVTLTSNLPGAYSARRETTFKGAVNANVVANGALVTFDAGSSLNGHLGSGSLANSTIVIDGNTNITIASGKHFANASAGVSGDSLTVKQGSTLTFAAGSMYQGAGAGLLKVDGTASFDTGMAAGSGGETLATAFAKTALSATGVAEIAGNANFGAALALEGASVGTVNVNTTGALGDGTDALDAKGAAIAVKSNTTFNGAVVTANAAGNAIAIDAGKRAVFTKDVTSGGGIAIGSGATGVFAGGSTITGAVAAAAGTFATQGAGNVTVATSLDAGGGTLAFGDNGSGGLTGIAGAVGSIVISGATKLAIRAAAYDGSTQTLTAPGVVNYSAAGDLDAYLAAQSTTTVNNHVVFKQLGAGGIQVTREAVTGTPQQRLTDAATILGYGGLAAGAGDSYAQAVINAAGDAAAGHLATNAVGERTGQILGALGGVDWLTSPITGSAPFAFAGGAAEAMAAYQGTSGKYLANTLYVSVDTVSRGFDLINNSLAGLAPGQLPAYGQAAIASENGLASFAVNCGGDVNRFWLGGFGMWDDADFRKGDAGYKYKSGGFATGFDRTFGGVLTVGGAFAYTAGSYKDKAVLSNDSDIDTYSFNLYAEYRHCSGFFGRLIGAYAYSDDDIDVRYTLADRDKADYHVNTWSIGGAVGYAWRPLPRLAVTPSVGLYHYNARSNNFRSTIRDGMKLKYDRTELPVELEVACTVVEAGDSRLTVKANAGWAYDFNDNRAHGDFVYNGLGVGSVYIEGRRPGRQALYAGGGVKYEYKRFEFGADYSYRHRSGMDSHAVSGTVGIRF